MKTLADIRRENPQYNDLSDDELAQRLHARFYSDMPYGDFSQRIGLQTAQERARESRPEGYNDFTGAAFTATHGQFLGASDEIRGAVRGAIPGAIEGFFYPERTIGRDAIGAPSGDMRVAPDDGVVPTSSATRAIEENRRPYRPQTRAQEDREIDAAAANLAPSGGSFSQRLVAAGRGAAAGFHNEAEGVRRQVEQFREERPNVALATEVAGGFATPGIGAATQGLRRVPLVRSVLRPGGIREAAVVGGGLGAAYGVATGDTMEERFDRDRLLSSTAMGSAGGAIINPLVRAGAGAVEAAANVASRFGLNADQRAVRIIDRAIQRQAATEDDLVRRGMTRAEARQATQSNEPPPMNARDLRGRRAAIQSRGQGTRENPSPFAEMNFELMGGQGEAMANAAANARGPGRDIAERAFARRTTGAEGINADPMVSPAAARGEALAAGGGAPGTVSERMTAAARRALPVEQTRVPQTYDEFAEALQQARSGQAREGYRRGLAEDPQPQPVAQRIEPLVDAMPAQARQSAARSGANQLEFEVGQLKNDLIQAQSSANPNNAEIEQLARAIARAADAVKALRAVESGAQLRTRNIWALDYFQRGLHQFETTLGRGAPEARVVANARRLFTRNLREAAPAWGEANAQYAQSMRLSELVEAGRSILKSPDRVEEVLRIMKGRLTTDERDALVVGVLEAIDTKLAQGDTRFVAQLMRRADWQEVLRRTMGDRNWAKFQFQVLREIAMRRREARIIGGSKTAKTQEDISDLTDGEAEMGFLFEALQSGSFKGPILKRVAQAWARMGQMSGIRNPAVNRALSRRLFQTATPSNVRNLEAEIAALPGYSRLGSIDRPAGEAGARAGALGAAILADREQRRRLGDAP